ncbi:MAG: helix-turn-helix domain-containing protein [Oscillospiraceae bacterium]|nr:helix-turn-helix domain-containing protein [Oscillospiraceae bacterium]
MAQNLKIKAARAEKDMTQKALAEAVGISRQTRRADLDEPDEESEE